MHVCVCVVNGVAVKRANVDMFYGTVHVIDGFIDSQKLAAACPQLEAILTEPPPLPLHNINLREAATEDLLFGDNYDNYIAEELLPLSPPPPPPSPHDSIAESK